MAQTLFIYLMDENSLFHGEFCVDNLKLTSAIVNYAKVSSFPALLPHRGRLATRRALLIVLTSLSRIGLLPALLQWNRSGENDPSRLTTVQPHSVLTPDGPAAVTETRSDKRSK